MDEIDAIINNHLKNMGSLDKAIFNLTKGDIAKDKQVKLIDQNNRLVYMFRSLEEMQKTLNNDKRCNVIDYKEFEDNYTIKLELKDVYNQ